jgi:hypothetical protein
LEPSPPPLPLCVKYEEIFTGKIQKWLWAQAEPSKPPAGFSPEHRNTGPEEIPSVHSAFCVRETDKKTEGQREREGVLKEPSHENSFFAVYKQCSVLFVCALTVFKIVEHLIVVILKCELLTCFYEFPSQL